ncbi:MAG TPA: cell division protein FtsH, partial [Burkholderiales bacterium]|nr:cell division protein FtsH [Burkholderiales bacterium]
EFSEETAREIDNAVRELVKGAFDRAVAILKQQRALLDRGAQLLLQKETLVEEELEPYRRELATAPSASPQPPISAAMR